MRGVLALLVLVVAGGSGCVEADAGPTSAAFAGGDETALSISEILETKIGNLQLLGIGHGQTYLGMDIDITSTRALAWELRCEGAGCVHDVLQHGNKAGRVVDAPTNPLAGPLELSLHVEDHGPVGGPTWVVDVAGLIFTQGNVTDPVWGPALDIPFAADVRANACIAGPDCPVPILPTWTSIPVPDAKVISINATATWEDALSPEAHLTIDLGCPSQDPDCFPEYVELGGPSPLPVRLDVDRIKPPFQLMASTALATDNSTCCLGSFLPHEFTVHIEGAMRVQFQVGTDEDRQFGESR